MCSPISSESTLSDTFTWSFVAVTGLVVVFGVLAQWSFVRGYQTSLTSRLGILGEFLLRTGPALMPLAVAYGFIFGFALLGKLTVESNCNELRYLSLASCAAAVACGLIAWKESYRPSAWRNLPEWYERRGHHRR